MEGKFLVFMLLFGAVAVMGKSSTLEDDGIQLFQLTLSDRSSKLKDKTER